jgi:hypothetical protein
MTYNENWWWGWRQTLSWKLGHWRGKSGRPYACPWWADERVYAVAFLRGKGVEISRDPLKRDPHPEEDGA